MFAGFPVHHMTDNVRVRWIQGRTLLRPRDRKDTAQTQYKYNNFIHFVCFDKIMIKKQIHTLCICRWKALQTTAVSIARKFCFMQWKIKFPTRENKVSPI